MKVQAIVPAAGQGKRIKKSLRKPFLILGKKPILIHSLSALSRSSYINDIIVVVDKRDIGKTRKLAKDFGLSKVTKIIGGGKSRFESVWNGLASTDNDTDLVLIHDGVRPFLNSSIIYKTIKLGSKFAGAVAAVPVTSTIKFVKKSGAVDYTPDRSKLWTITTPQVFRCKALLKGYKKCLRMKREFFDDSSVIEQLGLKIKVVVDSYKNIKITTPLDLVIGEAILRYEEAEK